EECRGSWTGKSSLRRGHSAAGTKPAVHERHAQTPGAVLIGHEQAPLQGAVYSIVFWRLLPVGAAESSEIFPFAWQAAFVAHKTLQHNMTEFDGLIHRFFAQALRHRDLTLAIQPTDDGLGNQLHQVRPPGGFGMDAFNSPLAP